MKLTVPTSWNELSQQQLLYVYLLLAGECYNSDELKTLCLVHFNGLKVQRDGNGDKYVFIDRKRRNLKQVHIKAAQVAEQLFHLDWLDTLPAVPVRLDTITDGKQSFSAYAADLSDMPFNKYIMLENYYTGYLHTNKKALLHALFSLLYQVPDVEAIEAFPAELQALIEINVLMWVVSFKRWAQQEFPHLYTSASADSADSRPLRQRLTDSANSMILTLTNGDITREESVLQQDTLRALTYLDYVMRANDLKDKK